MRKIHMDLLPLWVNDATSGPLNVKAPQFNTCLPGGSAAKVGFPLCFWPRADCQDKESAPTVQ